MDRRGEGRGCRSGSHTSTEKGKVRKQLSAHTVSGTSVPIPCKPQGHLALAFSVLCCQQGPSLTVSGRVSEKGFSTKALNYFLFPQGPCSQASLESQKGHHKMLPV